MEESGTSRNDTQDSNIVCPELLEMLKENKTGLPI
jgi:hypothetical protein